MNAKELRAKTENELHAFVKTTSENIVKLTMDVLKGKEKNVKKAGELKKDIARAKTILSEKKFLKENK